MNTIHSLPYAKYFPTKNNFYSVEKTGVSITGINCGVNEKQEHEKQEGFLTKTAYLLL